MAIEIVRLGTPRRKGESIRLGTVRRPPRGVPKEDFGRLDYYDVWLPTLSPELPLMKEALHAKTQGEWQTFVRKFRRQMEDPAARHTLDLLAALSHRLEFSLGCYCEDESHCHRSVLRELLSARDADLL